MQSYAMPGHSFTFTPLPGAYQAIKYKALLCAEKGLPLDTDKVKSMLIAWTIPPETQAFCKKYGVEWREYSLGAKNNTNVTSKTLLLTQVLPMGNGLYALEGEPLHSQNRS